MTTGQIAWPHLLADITAKRDALNAVIETLTMHFIRNEDATAPVMSPPPKLAAKTKPAARQPAVRSLADKAGARRTLADVVPAATTGTSASVEESVLARDVAIRVLLKRGPATSAAIRAAMPRAPWMTEEQIISATANALTRMRVKKEIKQVGNEWTLV